MGQFSGIRRKHTSGGAGSGHAGGNEDANRQRSKKASSTTSKNSSSKPKPARPASGAPGEKSSEQTNTAKKSATQRTSKAVSEHTVQQPTPAPALLQAAGAHQQEAQRPAAPGRAPAERARHAAGSRAAARSGAGAATRASPGPKPLRLFRYAVDASKVAAAIESNGWHHAVRQVDRIGDADAIIAVKLTPSGGHIPLKQGERAAANAGIPFVVAGRKMSAAGLRAALQPLLDARRQGRPLLEAAAAATARGRQGALGGEALRSAVAQARASWAASPFAAQPGGRGEPARRAIDDVSNSASSAASSSDSGSAGAGASSGSRGFGSLAPTQAAAAARLLAELDVLEVEGADGEAGADLAAGLEVGLQLLDDEDLEVFGGEDELEETWSHSGRLTQLGGGGAQGRGGHQGGGQRGGAAAAGSAVTASR